jgi:hypothetical protein
MTDDEKELVKRLRFPFGRPKTPEQITAERARLLLSGPVWFLKEWLPLIGCVSLAIMAIVLVETATFRDELYVLVFSVPAYFLGKNVGKQNLK